MTRKEKTALARTAFRVIPRKGFTKCDFRIAFPNQIANALCEGWEGEKINSYVYGVTPSLRRSNEIKSEYKKVVFRLKKSSTIEEEQKVADEHNKPYLDEKEAVLSEMAEKLIGIIDSDPNGSELWENFKRMGSRKEV